jgi:DNA modification methylase
MIDLNEKPPLCKTSVICRAVDNLELLLSQPDESVDLIYCDILYGTGRNFGEYQDLKPIRSEIESHYLPRIIEMKRVLKQNGSIYLLIYLVLINIFVIFANNLKYNRYGKKRY